MLKSTLTSSAMSSTATAGQPAQLVQQHQHQQPDDDNQLSVDTDFDLYWEEEARNPHRNRIRIGRQYQATVPPLLKPGEIYARKLEQLETLSFCSKKSAKVSDAELDHYFTVAKSLNLFASLVETRSLLGRDVTIADLNRIRNKEGLSLASVIQPPPRQATINYLQSTSSSTANAASSSQQAAAAATSNPSPQQSTASSSNANNTSSSNVASSTSATASSTTNTTTSATTKSSLSSPQKSPTADHPSQSPPFNDTDQPKSNDNQPVVETYAFNQPFMKALSHFISLHHPCHHDQDCKKLLKDIPLEDEPSSAGPMTTGSRRHSSSIGKASRSRSSLKQATAAAAAAAAAQSVTANKEDQQTDKDDEVTQNASSQSPSFEDWTREEVELFSRAIEVCGKNFSSIKKVFLPSKSVRSIVEFYYIGTRDASETKKKPSQTVETSDGCSSPEKSVANNNGQGGGGPSSTSRGGANSNIPNSCNPSRTTSSGRAPQNSDSSQPDKTQSNADEEMVSCPLNGHIKSSSKNIDVYNFEEDMHHVSGSPFKLDCPLSGAEVKPLKAKPKVPNSSADGNEGSNVGSLKFFMDGQLVLKLNACQEQQEGVEKCHWVQSGEKVTNSSRNKKYTKKIDKSQLEANQNGSHSNSVLSSYQDDDSKQGDLSGDEDSKESLNSVTNLSQSKASHLSPKTKKVKIKHEQNVPRNQSDRFQGHQRQETLQHQQSLVDHNRTINDLLKDKNLNQNQPMPQAMSWPGIPANSFAMAAALLGGLNFQQAPKNLLENVNQSPPVASINSSKPMDLSVEHHSPKQVQKSSNRSRSKSKYN